jgi:activator of HSP90 ATPase
MKKPACRSNHIGHASFAAFVITVAMLTLLSPAHAQSKKMAGHSTGAHGHARNEIIIKQEPYFNASPQRVYETLLSSKAFSDCTKKSFGNFTATSATIEAAVGGAFSVFDGHIIGRIVELVPNQRIIEAWRVVDWPAGVYSIARFDLEQQGSGTKLVFSHTGFPQGLKEHLATGWKEHYWDALNKYFQ